jgi:hypothetical protein
MSQKRNKTGIEFEKQICESNGWVPKSCSPRIKWVGKGRNNFKKLVNSNFDVNEFKPNLTKSKFEKFDAITSKGEKIEIKKYPKSKATNWLLYSEPIIKVAPSRRHFVKGDFVHDNVSEKDYNDFIDNLVTSDFWVNNNEDILNKITRSNIGIQFMDGFVDNKNIEFKWVINKGEYAPIFNNYNRLTIVFRVK